MPSYSTTPTDSPVDFSRWLGIAPTTIAQPVTDTPDCSATLYSQNFANGYRLEFRGIFSDYQAAVSMPGTSSSASSLKIPSNAEIYTITLSTPSGTKVQISATYKGSLTSGSSASDSLGSLSAEQIRSLFDAPILSGGPKNGGKDLSAFFLHSAPGTELASLLAGHDVILGSSNNDRLAGYMGNDTIYGNGGIDIAQYTASLSDYRIYRDKAVNGFTVEDKRVFILPGGDGKDTLVGVERLEFTDAKLALDLDGNAGKVAGLLKLVLGDASTVNARKAGIGLQLLDEHIVDVSGLARVALETAGLNTNSATVNQLWQGIFAKAPSAEEAKPFITALENGLSPASLTVQALDYWLAHDGLQLIGIADSGLQYQ